MTMGAQQYHTFVFEDSDGIYVKTSDAQTFDVLFAEIRQRAPKAQATAVRGGTMTRIHKLSNQDYYIAKEIKPWLLARGWELVGTRLIDREDEYYEYTFRRRIAPTATQSSRVPDIADQLEKLVNLQKSGAISTAEFEAAKRKLLGT
jgi:hypothetical protein